VYYAGFVVFTVGLVVRIYWVGAIPRNLNMTLLN